jgi:hypothetical protein
VLINVKKLYNVFPSKEKIFLKKHNYKNMVCPRTRGTKIRKATQEVSSSVDRVLPCLSISKHNSEYHTGRHAN